MTTPFIREMVCQYCGEKGYFSEPQMSEDYPNSYFSECQNCHQDVVWILNETNKSKVDKKKTIC